MSDIVVLCSDRTHPYEVWSPGEEWDQRTGACPAVFSSEN